VILVLYAAGNAAKPVLEAPGIVEGRDGNV
jgi:hypothetical protein